ncbi:hypothetical protein [Stx1a-converting phage Stx1_14744]|nr:hypothetical protein [Stx1a-converting phage Stx1_14744]
MGWLMISDKLITLVKSLCVLVGISFSLMLVAIFFSTAWRVLTLSGLVGGKRDEPCSVCGDYCPGGWLWCAVAGNKPLP